MMELQKIINYKIPKGTVLFADNACSTALSIMFTFDDLVPKKFTLICNIENDPSNIQNLLERFISMLEFEHIALLISTPIRKYQKHIQTILDFEFDICKIFTTIPNDDYSMLPKNIMEKSDIIQEIYQILVPITEHYSIIPSFPSLLQTILLGTSDDLSDCVENASSIIQNIYSQLLKSNLNINIRSYAFGDFSKKLAESLEYGRKGDNTESAALIIDRSFCCTPLFTNEGSLLDKAASINLCSVLQDSNLIKSDLNDNLLPTLCKILGIDEKSNFAALNKKWLSLSESEQFNLAKKYPSIKYIFDNPNNDNNLISQKIQSAQNSLLNGADFDDIFASYCSSLQPNQIVKILGFQNCIHRINIDEYLSDVTDDEKYANILDNCSSGVSFDLRQRSSFKLDELFFLPNLLNFIFDRNAAVNNEITAPSSGLIGFNLFKSSQPSLKSFKKIYVFVIGGVSFRELALIEKMEKSKSTNTEFHIFSDTICSSIHLLD